MGGTIRLPFNAVAAPCPVLRRDVQRHSDVMCGEDGVRARRSREDEGRSSPPTVLRGCYAISTTEAGYAATRPQTGSRQYCVGQRVGCSYAYAGRPCCTAMTTSHRLRVSYHACDGGSFYTEEGYQATRSADGGKVVVFGHHIRVLDGIALRKH
eukprot:2663379-Rhodomonas_salina.1